MLKSNKRLIIIGIIIIVVTIIIYYMYTQKLKTEAKQKAYEDLARSIESADTNLPDQKAGFKIEDVLKILTFL